MSECTQNKYLQNNKFLSISEFKDIDIHTGISVYEVLRVIDNKVIFETEHLLRLQNSAIIINEKLWLSNKEISNNISLLIETNNAKEGNIKIVFNRTNNERNFYCYFIKHIYPQIEEYENGISTIILKAERNNPNAKVYNHKLRSSTNTLINNDNIYEVLLENKNGILTEGSKSNLFFIKNNVVYTAEDSQVLHGIVREKVISICKELHIPLKLTTIMGNSISEYEAAFITGTSPQILAIRTIDTNIYEVKHPLLFKISEAYKQEIIKYQDKA